MKIKSITLQNYKRFVEKQTINFHHNDQINDITLLIGKNGTGKSTILQAIVCVVASAALVNTRPSNIDYPGFVFKHIHSGNQPARITVELTFSEAELEATYTFAQQLLAMGDAFKHIEIPNREQTISLKLMQLYDRIETTPIGSLSQTKGYEYATILSQFVPDPRLLFEQVGTIYWYSEQRTSYSLSQKEQIGQTNIENLRKLLVQLSNFNVAVQSKNITLSEGQQNFYEKLEQNYRIMFPGHRFVGAVPNFNNPYAPAEFFLSDGTNHYEIEEISAGERAVFPLLLDFSLNNINNSIIVIDESELHLHPSLHAHFLNILPQLGKNNQFFIATHSPQMLAASNANVIWLQDNGVITEGIYTQGRDINSILREYFDYKNSNLAVNVLLSEINNHINNYDVEKAQQTLDKLATIWGEQDLEVQRFQTYIDML
ncbi:MAG: AAA family ATPase [Chitinophagales bacterium]|nr:AAA family ATPase [Chitinophagales bacterium]HNI43401.1 AAA family ATPase [Chitinophagales bacterium]